MRKIIGSHNDPYILVDKNGGLTAELKLLMFFAFGIAFCIWFMKAVNFTCVAFLLV